MGTTTSQIEVTTPGAVYTGLAINDAKDTLYAANTAGGTIDVFDGAFAPKTLGTGAFANPCCRPGWSRSTWRTSTATSTWPTRRPAAGRPIVGPGGAGAVAVFDTSGELHQAADRGGKLASPWGITLAPSSFGQFGGDLLVGNFSYLDTEINAFDPVTGAFDGAIPVDAGPGNTSGGLWALIFGGGGNDGDPAKLYFSDGINGEMDGLFASIAVPEPSTLALLAGALALVAIRRRAGARAAARYPVTAPIFGWSRRRRW